VTNAFEIAIAKTAAYKSFVLISIRSMEAGLHLLLTLKRLLTMLMDFTKNWMSG